eukprot:scpid81314/ scgid5503/ 
MGGAASKSKSVAQAIPKVAAARPSGSAQAGAAPPRSAAQTEGHSQGHSSHGEGPTSPSFSANEAVERGNEQAAEIARRQHARPANIASMPEDSIDEGPDAGLLERLQNMVVESTDKDVERPSHPLKLPLKGTRRRQMADGGLTLPKGYSTYKHIMMALHFKQLQREGFRTAEDIAARLEIAEDDARALVRYFAVFKEVIDDSNYAIDERVQHAQPNLEQYTGLSTRRIPKPDP